MKPGEILQINGRLGFLMNPRMKILEVNGQMVLLEEENAKNDGLLSHTNKSWYGINMIESKLCQ